MIHDLSGKEKSDLLGAAEIALGLMSTFPAIASPLEASDGYCQCGCGERAPIATETSKKRGHIKGEPIRFINGHQLRKSASLVRKNGVLKTYPCQAGTQNVREHVFRAEKVLGKPLPPGAVVHHGNGSKNGGELVICQDQSYHLLLHKRMRALAASGHVGWLKCPFCKKHDDPKNLYTKGENTHYHRECSNEDKRNRSNICASVTIPKEPSVRKRVPPSPRRKACRCPRG